MRTIIVAILSLALIAPLASAVETDTREETGNILVGHPATELGGTSEVGLTPEGTDGFSFELKANDLSLSTATTDNGGLGYDVDVYFYDGTGAWIENYDCATTSVDESCDIPAGATTAWVDGWVGHDLDVTVTITFELLDGR